MDKTYIRDLTVSCIIGVYPHEREEKQQLVINAVLECDHSRAARSDNIEDALDYREIKIAMLKTAEESSFNLIESLAERLAALCLEHERVAGVTITLDKPGALRFARSVAVEITRRKQQADS